MNAIPFNSATVFRWNVGKEEVAAHAIGAFPAGSSYRLVLMDTSDRHWVIEVDKDGRLVEVVAGPVTGEQALAAAELVVSGQDLHGSVSNLINMLAIGMVAASCGQEAKPCA